MPTQRINDLIGGLSFAKKLLFAGSVLMIISLFLPWYSDIDTFKTGDMFLGLTGPLYLAGFSLLGVAILNLSMVFMQSSTGKLTHIPVKASTLHLASGIFAFYLLILVNSVYFHAKFGVNITIKQSDFGMFFAFIASSLLTIGGYLTSRDRTVAMKEFEQVAAEPILTMPVADMRKPKENLRNIATASTEQQASKLATQSNVGQREEVSKRSTQPFRTDL